ncbi:MAG: hypothetical protein VW080_08225 [Flavobacteriaceae bacterium]
MDLSSILSENKQELIGLLKSKLNLNTGEADKTLSTTERVISTAVTKETEKNGIGTLLNLFSDDDNSDDSNSFLEDVGKKLLKGLTSKGMDQKKALSIKDLILPLIMKFIAQKIGGKSDLLGSLLGGGDSSKSNPIGNILNKFF